jgi:NAD(P)-dependent dehydrogenase (short-subunit alcohol dehydrogenase family)
MTAPLLDGKVAIVSGVGPGLGTSVCGALREHGAQLVVGDLDAEAVARAVDEFDATGLVTDITDVEACAALVNHAVETHGRVDILVNDAYHGGDFTAFEDADLANWRATADVNVWGTLQMTRAALPVMKAQGDGRIVMVLTQGVEWVLPTFGAYTSSKSALAHLVKLLATELGQYGIRVNGVCPGPIFADALQGYLGMLAQERGVDVQVVYDEWAAQTALRYLVPPDEVAGSVVYLASDLARPVTGQAIYTGAGQWFH